MSKNKTIQKKNEKSSDRKCIDVKKSGSAERTSQRND